MSLRRFVPAAAFAAALAGVSVSVAADAEPTAKPKPANPGLTAPKPPTHKVEKSPLKVEVTLKGVFESAALTEGTVKPEVWGPALGGFTVVRAVEPGTAVKPGDVILLL